MVEGLCVRILSFSLNQRKAELSVILMLSHLSNYPLQII